MRRARGVGAPHLCQVQVDEALRGLLETKAEEAITADAIGELLGRLDTIAPATMVGPIAR